MGGSKEDVCMRVLVWKSDGEASNSGNADSGHTLNDDGWGAGVSGVHDGQRRASTYRLRLSTCGIKGQSDCATLTPGLQGLVTGMPADFSYNCNECVSVSYLKDVLLAAHTKMMMLMML